MNPGSVPIRQRGLLHLHHDHQVIAVVARDAVFVNRNSAHALNRLRAREQRPDLRQRRLLMHKREILKLFARIKQDGYSLIPLSIYFRGPRVKLELGLARGKKLYDKRESAARRDAKREMDRAMKSRNR